MEQVAEISKEEKKKKKEKKEEKAPEPVVEEKKVAGPPLKPCVGACVCSFSTVQLIAHRLGLVLSGEEEGQEGQEGQGEGARACG